MHSIVDLITFSEIAKLPKSDLKDICTDMSLDNSSAVFELAQSIWNLVKDDDVKRKKYLSRYKNKLLAGRMSCSWFQCDGLDNLKDAIIDKEKINPFERKIPFKPNELTTFPKLRSASDINNNEYFLRFIYKDGTRRIINEDVEVLPTTNTATVYINIEKKLIEVRDNPNSAQKIAEVIAGYIKQQISLNKTDIIKPFGYNINAVADKLNGELYESKASPELWIDNFSDRENEALVDILRALDNYFQERNVDELQEKLDAAAALLGEELLASPFIALILAGMGNVGLKVNESDLRHTALYNLFQPYLQPSGGLIRFNVEVDGVEKSYTIQIGIESKSIYFRSNSTTEEVIKRVRDIIV